MTAGKADWPKSWIGYWPSGDPWFAVLACTPPTNCVFTMLSSLIQKSVLSTATRIPRLNARPLLARAYHEKVISHYENPRNVSGSHPPAMFPVSF